MAQPGAAISGRLPGRWRREPRQSICRVPCGPHWLTLESLALFSENSPRWVSFGVITFDSQVFAGGASRPGVIAFRSPCSTLLTSLDGSFSWISRLYAGCRTFARTIDALLLVWESFGSSCRESGVVLGLWLVLHAVVDHRTETRYRGVENMGKSCIHHRLRGSRSTQYHRLWHGNVGDAVKVQAVPRSTGSDSWTCSICLEHPF